LVSKRPEESSVGRVCVLTDEGIPASDTWPRGQLQSKLEEKTLNKVPILYVLQIHVRGEATHFRPIIQTELELGRGYNSDIVLEGRGVSRQHLQIHCGDRMLQVRDMNSTNGTFMNGQRLLPDRPCMLGPGDQIRIEDFTLSVRLLNANESIPPEIWYRVRIATPPQPGLILNLPDGLRKVPLSQGRVILGSAEDNDIVMPELGVSPYHAELLRCEQGYCIHDLGSSGGLYHRGQRISRTILRDGARLLIGGRIPIEYRRDIGFVTAKPLRLLACGV